MGISLTKTVRKAFYNNNEVIQKACCIAPPSVTYKITPAVSTDPFAGKTNKYAESKLIAVKALTKTCHIRFGDSDIGDATTSDFCVHVGEHEYFIVDEDYPYLRVIETSATATVWVTEIY